MTVILVHAQLLSSGYNRQYNAVHKSCKLVQYNLFGRAWNINQWLHQIPPHLWHTSITPTQCCTIVKMQCFHENSVKNSIIFRLIIDLSKSSQIFYLLIHVRMPFFTVLHLLLIHSNLVIYIHIKKSRLWH